MIKEVKYNGITTIPADNICQDGDTEVLINGIPEDGTIKPITHPQQIFNLDGNSKIMYAHKTSIFCHYIIHNSTDNSIRWTTNGQSENTIFTLNKEVKIHQITAVGNTLIALTDKGLQHFLWKGTEYLHLGQKPPELHLSFGLQAEIEESEMFNVKHDRLTISMAIINDGNKTSKEDPYCIEHSEAGKEKLTEAVLAQVNKFIAEKSTKKGKFIFPFLVRYAYRLYDGTLIMHSAPVLMVTATSCVPDVFIFDINTHEHGIYTDNFNGKVVAPIHTLDVAATNKKHIETLQHWGDIIKSIDVFVSKPIYTYDQNGLCNGFTRTKEEENTSYAICKMNNQKLDTNKYPIKYQQQTISWMYAKYENSGTPQSMTIKKHKVKIPKRSKEQIKADIKDTATFYLLKSFKVNEISTARVPIQIEEEYLQSLVNREVMTDDYDSHDTIIPRYAFPYNSRINYANIQKQLYTDFSTAALFAYTNGGVYNFSDTNPTTIDYTCTYHVYFHIKQDGKELVVKGKPDDMALTTSLLFLYYPNTNCYKATIARVQYAPITYIELPMQPHNHLNGAFYFEGWEHTKEMFQTGIAPQVSNIEDITIKMPNKIYTSDVNNPFRFPVTSINTIGAGEIIGLSSAAKALSQGQFGQFPLYAFTTEGVWAMEVAHNGSYIAKQPITRDICINQASITQIDTAVLFASQRGIILLQGAETTCISDIVYKKNGVKMVTLPQIGAIIQQIGVQKELLNPQPWEEFIQECQMIYDYQHQRIIVYRNDTPYAYLFSLKTRQWGMMQTQIQNSINTYPEAIAVLKTGEVVNFSQEQEQQYKSIIITRPIKLDAPDVHKTIDTIIQRGVFQKGHVKTILYASNDLYNWVLVWSSQDHTLRGFRGTPYKYFRIVLIAQLGKEESITGCSIQFAHRLNNRLR